MIPEPIRSTLTENRADTRLAERLRIPTVNHNITVTLGLEGINARQINRQINLGDEQKALMTRFAETEGLSAFNIPPAAIPDALNGKITREQIVPNPVSVIMISSYGLLNGSTWTSHQPSEGIYVIGETLARNSPYAAPVCIDPNMMTVEQFQNSLLKYGNRPNTIVGYSPLPVNLRNDAYLMSVAHSTLPNSRLKVVGGIGSGSLTMLPTESGKKGIQHALPVDLIVPGYGVREMQKLVELVYGDNLPPTDELVALLRSVGDTVDYNELDQEIQRARTVSRQHFIPMTKSDIVHPKSYLAANEIATTAITSNTSTVLTDNRCGQGCFFCATPKNAVFGNNIGAAMDYLRLKTVDSAVIAFNNNDLSDQPQLTIDLCNEMIAAGINQPKHGKMRATEFNPDLINALAGANFKRIAIGVETFDPDLRARMSKRDFTATTIDDTLAYMIEKRIQPEINLILFPPFETLRTLQTTTTEALQWVDKGASLYATVGLFATPNSPGIMQLMQEGRLQNGLVDLETINYPGMNEGLLYPTQWRVRDPETAPLKNILLSERAKIVTELEARYEKKIPVPIEAYAAMAWLANYFKLPNYDTQGEMMNRVTSYADREIQNQYISI